MGTIASISYMYFMNNIHEIIEKENQIIRQKIYYYNNIPDYMSESDSESDDLLELEINH